MLRINPREWLLILPNSRIGILLAPLRPMQGMTAHGWERRWAVSGGRREAPRQEAGWLRADRHACHCYHLKRDIMQKARQHHSWATAFCGSL